MKFYIINLVHIEISLQMQKYLLNLYEERYKMLMLFLGNKIEFINRYLI